MAGTKIPTLHEKVAVVDHVHRGKIQAKVSTDFWVKRINIPKLAVK